MIRSIFLGVFVVSLALFGQALAQTREITKAEFEEISRRAYDNLANLAHRIKITNQSPEPRLGDILSQTIEKESSVRWKNESLVKTASGTRRDNRVRVDDKEFEKIGNEPWREPEKGSIGLQ